MRCCMQNCISLRRKFTFEVAVETVKISVWTNRTQLFSVFSYEIFIRSLFIDLYSIVESTSVLVNNSNLTEDRCRRFTNIYTCSTLCLNTLRRMDTHEPTANNELGAHWVLIRFQRHCFFFTISINLHCTFWTKHCFILFAMEITLVGGWCYCYFEALFTLATLRIWKFEILNLNSGELLCVPFQPCSRFKFIAWINRQRRTI